MATDHRTGLYRGHASVPTPEYIKSVGEQAPHGALTVGFVGRLNSALTKAIDLIADLNARLDRLEGKKP